MKPIKKYAPRRGAVEKAKPTADPISKIDRVLQALHEPDGLNRFEAERLGDHTLNSTIADLRNRGVRILSCWEIVPTKFNQRGVRVMRYWAAA